MGSLHEDFIGADFESLSLCVAPSARHRSILASYLLNIKRGEAVVFDMMLADYHRFLDLGARERASDLLHALWLFNSLSCDLRSRRILGPFRDEFDFLYH
jgi:hypothetical protein